MAGLQDLPTELGVQIVGCLDSPRDVVAVDYALYETQFREDLSYDWRIPARKHVDNLLKDPDLCKQIRYNDNERESRDGKRLRPSKKTRLPTTYTYAQMFRFESYRPDKDLDGRPISLDDIERFYEEDVIKKRSGLVFLSRVDRNEMVTSRQKPERPSSLSPMIHGPTQP